MLMVPEAEVATAMLPENTVQLDNADALAWLLIVSIVPLLPQPVDILD